MFIGTIFIAVSFFGILSYHLTDHDRLGFEASIIYWHFVDVVWLFLYVCIYWWGSSFSTLESIVFTKSIRKSITKSIRKSITISIRKSIRKSITKTNTISITLISIRRSRMIRLERIELSYNNYQLFALPLSYSLLNQLSDSLCVLRQSL